MTDTLNRAVFCIHGATLQDGTRELVPVFVGQKIVPEKVVRGRHSFRTEPSVRKEVTTIHSTYVDGVPIYKGTLVFNDVSACGITMYLANDVWTEEIMNLILHGENRRIADYYLNQLQ